MSDPVMRKIIHIDMDAFYASVEQRDQPEYRNRPVIVGGDPGRRGVVAACSYEARQYGIHSAMPASRAKRLCPDAIFLRPRMTVYREVSAQIREIFQEYTSLIEPLSLDEAYLDVTDADHCQGSATLIAKEIKTQIKLRTNLIASAGISYNKFLAKIASDMDKPDGLFLIKPDQGEAFIEQLPIGKFYGIGPATEARMKSHNIHNGADLKSWKKTDLIAKFGKVGTHYYQIARGLDTRPVNPTRVRKSLGSEHTFDEDLIAPKIIQDELAKIVEKVAHSLQEKQLSAKTLTIKIKYDDFEQITRSRTLSEYFDHAETMQKQLPFLLQDTEIGHRKVRLLGVSASNLIEEKTHSELQLGLFI